MIRLLLLALGAALGYALRRPVCERTHSLPRHLDPAIVRQPPEDDGDIQPPDPRTWPTTDGTFPTWTWKAQLGTSDSALSGGARTGGARTWPDTLEHEGDEADSCPRCEADRWLRRGARRA